MILPYSMTIIVLLIKPLYLHDLKIVGTEKDLERNL